MRKLGATIKRIYTPKYAALSLALGVAYYAAFWYLAYIQGGNAVMLYVPLYLIFLLVASSSMLTTVAVYSIRNTRENNAKISGTATSASTLLVGSGLCGCTTTLLPTLALAVGAGTPAVYALSSFLKNYNIEILSALVILNMIVLAYYINKLSSPKCMIRKKVP
jgi:hypothetical protein